MSTFNPEKLMVNLIPPAQVATPLSGRKYTLTHSDITGALYLDIGSGYNYAAIDFKKRDEVLAEWKKDRQNHFALMGNVHVDGKELNKHQSEVRFNIFKKEMDTALKGILFGDHAFFTFHPFLLDAPIFINYNSVYPQFNQVIYYGTPRHYLM